MKQSVLSLNEEEQWTSEPPEAGDQLRVNRGGYYHHGIYIGDNQVIHFGTGNSDTDFFHGESNLIHQSDIAEFLSGGLLEKRVYGRREKRLVNSPKEIIALAKSKLGEGGYNFLHYNCEHFSNECAFSERYSMQVERYRAQIKAKVDALKK